MINLNGKSYKLYYLDTCALSELVKDRKGFGSNLLNLVLTDGIIAISPHSLWELKSSPTVYKDVLGVLLALPTALLKSEDMLADDEYQLFTQKITTINPICHHLIKQIHEQQGFDILNFINSHITDEKNELFKKHREETFNIVGSRPTNIVSRENLKTKKSVEWSVKLLAYELSSTYLLAELNYYVSIKKEFPIEKFPSLMATAYILHYKYIQEERKGSLSDIQDVLMAAIYPYVDVVVTERNQCAIVKQIQKRHSFFDNLNIISINQVRSEEYI